MTSLELVLAGLDEAFDRRSWHGTNLRGSIRGLSARDAARRPAPGRHNIWEIVVHAAYWKYTVWRRLTGQKRGSFPLKGSNWFRRPAGDSTERAWKADVDLLVTMHRNLRRAVAQLAPDDLDRRVPGGAITIAWLLRGVSAHDLYHTGQIQLIKRLR